MLDLRRRQLITLLGGAVAAWPLAAHAQQPDRLRRIAVLSPLAEDDPEMTARLAGFRQGLEKRGWSEGRNVRIRRVQLALQAMRHTIPATYPFRDFSEAGGLMSYGASLRDALRQVGAYTGRVLTARSRSRGCGSRMRDWPDPQTRGGLGRRICHSKRNVLL